MRYACCVLLAILSSAHVPAAPLSTSTLKASDLRSATAWLADVTSYEITLACTLSMPGFAYTIEMEHKALRPWYAETRLELPGFTRYYVCDNDSLWTSMPGMKTYTVEPWHGLAVSPDAAPTAGSAAMEPPYFFDFLRQVVVPEGDLEFEFESEGTLDMDGRPLVCEIWRPVSGSFAEKVDHVWIDPDRRIIMMTEGSAEDEKFGTVGFEFRVASLTLDGGLQPSDFEFTPEPGMTRVSASAKLLVGDSLEGEAAPAAEFRDLDGGTVSTSDWRGRIVVLDFWATWCGPCLKGLPHLQALRREYGDDVVIVGVTRESLATVGDFLADRPSNYPILLDPEGKAGDAFRVSSLPALYLLDGGGVVREHFVGMQPIETIRDALARMAVAPVPSEPDSLN